MDNSGLGKAGGATFEGRTVDDAISRGLVDLSASRDGVTIEVLDKGSRGFLGLGRRVARVRIVSVATPSEEMARLAESLLTRMGFPARVRGQMNGRAVDLRVEVEKDNALLIGRRGETLQALEHVLLRMAGQRVEGGLAQVRVELGGYRDRRDGRLEQVARNLAEQAIRTGKRAMSEPLPPADRQVVHRILAADARLETHATGEGAEKRILVVPRRRKNSR